MKIISIKVFHDEEVIFAMERADGSIFAMTSDEFILDSPERNTLKSIQEAILRFNSGSSTDEKQRLAAITPSTGKTKDSGE